MARVRTRSGFALLACLSILGSPAIGSHARRAGSTSPAPQTEPAEPYEFSAFGQAEPELPALVAEARALVERELKIELPAKLAVRYADRDELAERLAREPLTRHLAKRQRLIAPLDDDGELSTAATVPLAEVLLAKHFPADDEVLIVLGNLEASMRLGGIPPARTAQLLRAVLVHELVHVADEVRHGWQARTLALETPEAIQAYMAVLEGHAQLVARRLCAKAGWSAGFDGFASLIGLSPDLGEGAAAELLARSLTIAASFSYHSGEAFWRALEASGVEDFEARAFGSPPDDPRLISRPEWWLHPELRPQANYDLEAGLTRMERERPDERWLATRVDIPLAQLEAATQILGPGEFDRVRDALIQIRALVIQPSDAPGSSLFQGVLYEAKDTAGAAYWVSMQERVMRLRDEAMKEGAISIRSADYERVAHGPINGLRSRKIVVYQGQDIPVKTAVLARESVVVEMTASNYEIDADDLLTIAEAMLNAVVAPADPREGEGGSEGAAETSGEAKDATTTGEGGGR